MTKFHRPKERSATVAAILARGRTRLASGNLENPSLDARVLLGHVTGLTREQMIVEDERQLSQEQRSRFDTLVERRLTHEPVAYLVGAKEFHGLTLTVTPDTLIPRPDTETLVDKVIGFCIESELPPRILDLGTGSGAILLAVLHACQNANGIGVDRSCRALDVARQNAIDLGLAARADFVQGNWAADLDGTFDVIATNPPYIKTGDMADLMPDVAMFEPVGALDGGADGLDPLRLIAPEASRMLVRSGLFCTEIGLGQEAPAKDILDQAGFQIIESVPDLNGIMRCLVARAS